MRPRAVLFVVFACALAACALASCGPRPVVGGTRGRFTVPGHPTADMQVTVYAEGSTNPLGFGVTNGDGEFELVTPGAQGPLVLPAGEYRFTLESVGAPLAVPAEYTQPTTTPLQAHFAGEDRLELEAPLRPQAD